VGLYFKGRAMLFENMLKRYLNIPCREQILGVTYSCELLEPTERLWITTNLENGKTVVFGDEGNNWCIPLIVASSREEAVKAYLKNPPKARFRSLAEVLEALAAGQL